MSSLESLLLEARQLAGRLQSREEAADSLIGKAEALKKRMEGQRQYQEDVCQLSELAACKRPRAPPAAENKRVKELEAENAELRLSLEEHQTFMEVLMNKYREQMRRSEEVDLAARQQPALAASRESTATLALQEKVQEMACVMREALRREDDHVTQLEEDLTRLRTENATLRELLRIATAAAAAASGCASRSGSTSGAAAGASVGGQSHSRASSRVGIGSPSSGDSA
uniref:FGFR1 oncogene partner 2 n=1 Tax=Macrostomum lignano TaxID=282301 RepID=A0A1I8IB66_9PLAT